MERTITANAVPQAKTRTMTNFRWKIAFLIFLISFVAYMDRVNLSVATPVIMQEFGFDKMDMGFLQTCFFAGYALMQVPGGMLAERFGLRKTGAGAILWWSVFTALTAFAQGKASFAAVRLAFGLGEGPVFPSLGQATFNWFNKDEKGKASSAILLGTFFGPVIGPMVTVALIAALGWHAVFIIFGLAGCVLAWVWHRYAQDNPKDSPYVNEEEAAFINEGRSFSAEKKSAPWGRFLRSRQFWALGIQFFVVDYIMYVFLAWLPLYLTEVHNLSLKSMGIWASFPWLALMAMVFTAGFLSDRMAHSKNSSRQYTMRTFTAMAGVAVTSLGLYIAAHTASGAAATIFWMSVSLGALGFSMSASWSTVISLGGKYTGSVSGWMNLWGNVGGVLAPIVTAFFVTNYGWNNAFTYTALFGIIAIAAWLFVNPGKQLEGTEE